eukprot:CAMPEP_0117750874 /NCGR_PEP_ID=MMETSP0947-20121206/10637_1 /TAXON_ID=44440 /ORGANISM="Chattonella subsalsa, Strain CCMP2191" /LENGTH=116 /DNA_ID=CAMNT_0005569143 /DNA_START=77 /DNA_END=427 /DNA_ORIENTATION=-
MRHLAAYLMLVMGGNPSPTAEDVTNALASVGIEVDEERLNALISELEGKELDEIIEAGKEKLASFGGGGGGAAAGGGGGAAAGGDAPAEEEKKEEEEEADDALEGGMDMFGDGGDY